MLSPASKAKVIISLKPLGTPTESLIPEPIIPEPLKSQTSNRTEPLMTEPLIPEPLMGPNL